MDSDLPNVPTGHAADEASKRELLRALPTVIVERCWVTISPDGTAEPDYIPRDTLVKVSLDFNLCDAKPQIVLETTAPAIVYFNGTVHLCLKAAEFFRKDVITGWNDLIIGL